MNHFPQLFSPLKIGNVTTRNRIGMAPHGLGWAVDKCPTEHTAYYYAERAKGGVGLIITEAAAVHPSGDQSEGMVKAYDPRVIPGYRRIAEMVHAEGAPVFGQLWHQGAEFTSAYSEHPLWGPSAVPSRYFNEMPHVMDRDDIREVQEGWAKASGHLQQAGLDGVEIHGGHGFLVHQFLSPLCNLREDEYGGTLENRLRFAVETLATVRKRVGRTFVIGMRLSGDEFTPGGLGLDDMKVVSRHLASTGDLDYISVTVGNTRTRGLQIGDMNVPPGAIVYLAAGIKEAVDIPVFGVMRINTPELAEKVIAEGHADMALMVRALIADPELPNKAREGRVDDIRYCVACVQECRKGDGRGAVHCTQNVAVGREKEFGLGTLKLAAKAKNVVVVGGGPGGMEAARIAAERGHRVTLFEKASELGGQLNIATKVRNREELGGITRFLSHELNRLGVMVRLGVTVDVDTISTERPDAVVIATGSVPRDSQVPGAQAANVLSADDALLKRAPIGERVVIVDSGEGFWPCIATAEHLADEGKDVEIVSPGLYVGPEIPLESFNSTYQRLHDKNVALSSLCALKEIRHYGDKSTVVVFNPFSKREREINGVDTIVMAIGQRVNDGLFHALKGKVPELYAIGDCLAPRRITEAIRDGHYTGRSL